MMRWKRKKEHAVKYAQCSANYSLDKKKYNPPSIGPLFHAHTSKYLFSHLDYLMSQYYHLIFSICPNKFTCILISYVYPLFSLVPDRDDSKSFQKAPDLLYHKYSSRSDPCWNIGHIQDNRVKVTSCFRKATRLSVDIVTKYWLTIHKIHQIIQFFMKICAQR